MKGLYITRRNCLVGCVHIAVVIVIFTTALPNTVFSLITFERTYGGDDSQRCYSIAQTMDGGYIMTGYIEYWASGENDVYLFKTDSLGDSLWARIYGDMRYRGNAVQQTSDAGYIITGWTETALADYDVHLMKTDSLGNLLWEKTYGGIGRDEGRCVQKTLDGGYIVAGVTRSFGAGLQDVYLIKTDSLGDSLWTATYGGSSSDEGYSARQTQDGGYVIAGQTGSFGSGWLDSYLLKTDSLGSMLWERAYGGSLFDHGYSVQQTQEGGYVVAGETESFGAGGYDVYLIKTDLVGDTVWTRTYGDSCWDQGRSVQQTEDRGYIITGYTESDRDMHGRDVYLVKTDSLGNALWEKRYGGTRQDIGHSVRQTSDGGYVVVGYTESFPVGNVEVYVIKTDENGLVGAEEQNAEVKIGKTVLYPNTPNPFQNSTVIGYSLSATSETMLRIYDITGRLVETLVNETQQPGNHQVRWDRKDNPSGVYFYGLRTGYFTETKKMVVVE